MREVRVSKVKETRKEKRMRIRTSLEELNCAMFVRNFLPLLPFSFVIFCFVVKLRMTTICECQVELILLLNLASLRL